MSVTERVASYRERMRAKGYRPVQVWVPDTRSEEFAQEARRQSQLVAAADRTGDDQDFVDAISILWEE